jgi:hypothetical protein
MELIVDMQTVTTAYSYLSSGKRKERFDVILEPLQAVCQLAFLKFCPTGTKVSIENNLLFTQMPHWHQGLTRAWKKDKREDILLLFNAVQRFNKIYVIKDEASNKKESGQNKNGIEGKLVKLVARMAIEGIDNLINTYSRVDNANITQTLIMYKNVLQHPDRFSNMEELSEGKSKSGKSMEEVFAQIKDNWTEDTMSLMYWTLRLMESDPSNYEAYVTGVNQSLSPTYTKIRKWMSDNIVY